VFDRGLGDLFVVRTGAQTVDDVALTVARLRQDTLLRDTLVVGGRYDLDTGWVTLIA
jgi:carbonic anhydrase